MVRWVVLCGVWCESLLKEPCETDFLLCLDGVNGPYGSGWSGGPPTASKSVSFIPLSPKSSRTMERHRREQVEGSEGEDWDNRDPDSHPRDNRFDSNRRRSSDPTPHPLVQRSRRSRDDSSGSDSDDIEVLPDRFDSRGRPLHGRSASQDGWTTRRGTFRREPQRPGGWDVSGAWQVSGTDGEAVDKLVRDFTGALDGHKGWMGVLGQVLGSGLLPGAAGPSNEEHGSGRQRHEHDVDDDDGRRRRRRTQR